VHYTRVVLQTTAEGTSARKAVCPANAFAAEEARIRAAYARRGNHRTPLAEPAGQFNRQQRERILLGLLAAQGFAELKNSRILEIGCGTGAGLRAFARWGARPENLTGVDLLPERIAEARRLCPPQISLSCGSAAHLESADASFDLVLQSTVFTSILDLEMKRQVAREMLRVLRPAGLIVWYDFRVNNPWNPDVRGVKRGEIAQLFPGCQITLRRLTLAPPLGRLVARLSPWLYRRLSAIKPLSTHYLGMIRKP